MTEFPKNVKNIEGQTFGSLKAVQYLGCVKPWGALWTFKCKCGKIINKHAGRIITSGQRSCGCERRRPKMDQAIRMSYCTHVKAAKMRGIESFLTRDQWSSIALKSCEFCGSMSTRKNKRFGEVKLNSVDRRNNEQFYTMANSVPACIRCNMMKNSSKAEEFIEHAKLIARFNGGA